MSKTEHRIAYKAGITRTPSDFLCEDGELAECINLTTDHEELKVMVQPKEWMSGAPEILYVHRVDGKDIIIGHSGQLVYGENNGGVYTGIGTINGRSEKPVSIVSVGRVLVVSYSDGISYYRMDPTSGRYQNMSSSLSNISVKFSLSQVRQEDTGRPLAYRIDDLIHHKPVINPEISNEYFYYLYTENDGEYSGIKDVLIGAVSERVKKVAEQKRFAFPFWARYAVRLYDGSYTAISQPFLLFPTVNHNCDIFFSNVNGGEQHMHNREWSDGVCLNYKPYSAELKCQIVGDYSSYEDVISGIDIFVSEQQMPFNLEGDWHFINPFDAEHQGGTVLYNHAAGGFGQRTITPTAWGDDTEKQLGFVTYFGMSHISDSEIMQQLLDKSSFYLIARIDYSEFDDYSGAHSISDKMTQTTLKMLTSQTRLDQDDYYSRNAMTAQVMKSYNGRLHLAQISRSFFDGFDAFTGAEYNEGWGSYRIAVNIKTDSGMRRVIKDTGASYQIMNIWFYYPDPRATSVQIYDTNSGTLLFDHPLTEHKSLNGAYFFDHLPYAGESMPAGTSHNPPNANDAAEEINDRIFVSEADNPFVFTSRGDVRVGQGDIRGMATQTVALGQEEHGLHPLLVFTERGISTLKVTNEGQYERTDELNREVCINAGSITETDGAVFFVSRKGLMMTVGNRTSCVSELMNGRAFNYSGLIALDGDAAPWANVISACQVDTSFLDYVTGGNFRMAYDYADSRLLLVNPSKQYVFVFSLSDGTISKAVLGSVSGVVNNYPDYLIQSGDTVYSLYGKDREESLTARRLAFLLTRPMKLSGPVGVKSLRELVNVGCWSKKNGSKVKTQVLVSDDLEDWYEMGSRFGAAAKYFRIALYIEMLPKERLSGTILYDQERRDDNARVAPTPATP